MEEGNYFCKCSKNKFIGNNTKDWSKQVSQHCQCGLKTPWVALFCWTRALSPLANTAELASLKIALGLLNTAYNPCPPNKCLKNKQIPKNSLLWKISQWYVWQKEKQVNWILRSLDSSTEGGGLLILHKNACVSSMCTWMCVGLCMYMSEGGAWMILQLQYKSSTINFKTHAQYNSLIKLPFL